MKKILLSILLIGLIMPSLSRAAPEIPETIEEGEEIIKEILEKSTREIPKTMEESWKNEVLPKWKKMAQTWSNWWDNTIQPWFIKIINKIKTLLGQEVEKRKPQIEEDFQKEKEELLQNIGKKEYKTKSIWERIKELFKNLRTEPEVIES